MFPTFWHIPELFLEVSEPNFKRNVLKWSGFPVTLRSEKCHFHSELIKTAHVFEFVDVFASNHAILNRFRGVDFFVSISENRLPKPIFVILCLFLHAYTS